MRRIVRTLFLIGPALLLAACQDPPPTFTYDGTTVTAGIEQSLTLIYQQRGEHLTGEYRVRNSRGAFRGVLNNTTITATLTPGPDCAYAFEGTLIDTALTGAFQPSDCPGGQSGTWALELQ